jgi:tripartite-type tricarboxylate transporter receptor subunit TctC
MARFGILRRAALGLTLGAALGAFSLPASSSGADSYPDRPITMIVPFAPGGPADLMGRNIARHMTESLGETITVVNRAGAGGNVGTDVVARANADGYTIGISLISSLSVAPSLLESLPYDVERDIAPISMVGIATPIIVAHPSAPFDTFEEFLAYVRENPGRINYSTPGVGTAPHLASEWLSSLADIDINHVPYRGTGPARQDLLAGVIPVGFESSLVTAARAVESGHLKALAVMTENRSDLMPDTPTLAELGFDGFDASNWFCLIAPAGTPPEIIGKLHAATTAALQDPEIIETFAANGIRAEASTPDELREHIRQETAHWGQIIRDNNIVQQ